MPDISKYWKDIRRIEGELPEFAWLISHAHGRIVQVRREPAAKLLHRKSFRLATEEEVERHRSVEDEGRRIAVKDGLRRRGVTVVVAPARVPALRTKGPNSR